MPDFTESATKTCRGCSRSLPATRENFYMSSGRFVNYCKPCYRTRYNRTNGTQRGTSAAIGRTARSAGRAFGVELELTGPSRTEILAALAAVGINADVYGYRASNGSHWELKTDCSVNGAGLELVSPKLRGESGFAQLQLVCEALASVGATVNRTCGLHVHHDMRAQDVNQIRAQVAAFVSRQSLIFRMVAPSRRNNSYCAAWTSESTAALMRAADLRAIGAVGPRGAINLHAYPRHGSVEVRCHAGSTNFKKISAWVRFGQSLFAAALAGANVSTTDITQMLTDLIPFGLTTEDASWLLRFETSGETRGTVEARVATLQAELDAARSVLEEVE